STSPSLQTVPSVAASPRFIPARASRSFPSPCKASGPSSSPSPELTRKSSTTSSPWTRSSSASPPFAFFSCAAATILSPPPPTIASPAILGPLCSSSPPNGSWSSAPLRATLCAPPSVWASPLPVCPYTFSGAPNPGRPPPHDHHHSRSYQTLALHGVGQDPLPRQIQSRHQRPHGRFARRISPRCPRTRHHRPRRLRPRAAARASRGAYRRPRRVHRHRRRHLLGESPRHGRRSRPRRRSCP